ncbi:MAG: PIN domain-containing protein [Candidatus Micrarchaeota archaeon]
MILIDSSAWIEYIKGSERGEKVRGIADSGSVFTIGIILSEVAKWCEIHNIDADANTREILEICTDLLEPSLDAWIDAGKLNAQINRGEKNKNKRIGLVDCIIATTAFENQLRIITLDSHFEKINCERIIL